MANGSNKYTIFLPVKNGGKYLPLCVESILAQTYRDFELVILENQSTDGTALWLQDLEGMDTRVKVLPSATNLSIEDNWSRILSAPKNKYMTIIGHDDLLEPDFLAEINSLIESEPEANLYLTHFKLIDSAGDLIRYCKPIPKYETAAEFLAARLVGIRDSFGTGYVMRSEHYNQFGGIPSFSHLLYADDALWLNLMNNSIKVTSLRVGFSYRLHAGSISGKPNLEALYNGLNQYLRVLIKLLGENKDLARVARHFAPQYLANFYCYYTLRMALQGKRIDQQRMSELEMLLKEIAPEAILEKSYKSFARYLCGKLSAWLASKCQY